MTPPAPLLHLALIGNLDLSEVLIILLVAVMVFGRKLPRVAAQAVAHVQRARRALQQVWRESGIGEEFRQVQRELDQGSRALRDADPRRQAALRMRELEAEVRRPAGKPADEGTSDPDAERAGHATFEEADEPAGEKNRVPSWYPKNLRTPTADDFAEADQLPRGAGISPGGLPPAAVGPGNFDEDEVSEARSTKPAPPAPPPERPAEG